MSQVYRRSVLVFGVLAIVLGFAILVRTAYEGGGTVGFAVGGLFVALGAARLYLLRKARVARKLPQLQRVLDAPALASVAYGEIASSLYFALGVIALHALGLTPVVLGVVGMLFLIVALSYAEGTASIRETGGAATFVRVAFNDLAGFLTGWALFLDYLIVISLSALFVPHYLGLALGIDSIAKRPGDVIAACVVVAGIAAVRLTAANEPLQRSGSRCRCSTSSRSSCSSRLGFDRPLLAERADARSHARRRTRRGTTSRSRSRSRCSRTPGSRPSRTTRRRRGGPAATCRAASSARSRSSS